MGVMFSLARGLEINVVSGFPIKPFMSCNKLIAVCFIVHPVLLLNCCAAAPVARYIGIY